ncbi:MAG: biotin/lipoyl-containing protein [Bacteroidota bacterium]
MEKTYKVKINDADLEHQVSFDDVAKTITMDDKKSEWDVVVIKPGIFHIIKDSKSYNAEVMEADYSTKSFLIRINGNNYSVVVKDRFDGLLHDLGMDVLASNKKEDLKAPMPGLVLDVRVSEGQQIGKNDAILVLEAMKMENILKAASDGIIKKILVKKGDKVEKNQVLVMFE